MLVAADVADVDERSGSLVGFSCIFLDDLREEDAVASLPALHRLLRSLIRNH